MLRKRGGKEGGGGCLSLRLYKRQTGRVYRDNGRDGGPSARFLYAAATSGHDFPNISFDSESRGGEGMGLGAAADRVPGLMRSQVGNDTENCATGFFPGAVIVCRVFRGNSERFAARRRGSYATFSPLSSRSIERH